MNAPEFSDVFPLDESDDYELTVHADDLFGQVVSEGSGDEGHASETSVGVFASDAMPGALPGFYSESRIADESLVYEDAEEAEEDEDDEAITSRSFMQNRELSWLTFNERVLDQGADESVPLLERLNFISIFWSNLQEFFMVRVGSLTDLSFIEPPVKDSKTGMTPKEQIKAIHKRCRELYPIQESYYEHVRGSLAKQGVRHLRPDDLSEEQYNYLDGLVQFNIMPFLSPQIINPRHPFPHLENGKLYILVRLDDEVEYGAEKKKKAKKGKKVKTVSESKGGAEGVVLGLIPLPHQCERVIKLPGRGFQFILLEHAIEMFAADIFSMYTIKHTNVICVTRNADIDANQTGDEQDEDYREHMKRLLKQRARLAPVRLECERPLSPVMQKHLLKKLGLKRSQVYDTIVPLDLSFTWGLGSRLSDSKRQKLSNPPFTPAWPAAFDRNRRIMDQVSEKEVLLSYPYESMDPFVQLLKEAAFDPTVVSIKITLYRLASQSQLAEALIAAAENGKEVTALFELRARFDESNNIEWSQRFEQAGCNVIYGFRDYKVHSKICSITRQLPDGTLQQITQLGTGNYNEKTAKLYTDLSFITTDESFGKDATEFFRNMQLESVSDNYKVLCVAPLQIKPMILGNLDRLIAVAREGKPCGAFLKANSITDVDVIEKIAEASQAGVRVTLFVRGICCLIPELKGATDNVRVVSIVGRLLEHSRIYCFSTEDDCAMYLSSADLMTRNLNKRVEIAWPILNREIRTRILDYIEICMNDTAKLRELRPDSTYTPLGAFCDLDEEGNAQAPFDAQSALIEIAAENSRIAEERYAALAAAKQAEEEGLAAPVKLEVEPESQEELEPESEPTSDAAFSADEDSEIEAEPESESSFDVEFEPEPASEEVTEPEPESSSDAIAESGSELEPYADGEPEPEPTPQLEDGSALESASENESVAESGPEFESVPGSEQFADAGLDVNLEEEHVPDGGSLREQLLESSLDSDVYGFDLDRDIASDDDALDLDSEHDLYLEFDIVLEPEDKVISRSEAIQGTPDVGVAAQSSFEESILDTPSDEVDVGRAEVASVTEPIAAELPEGGEDVPLTELTIDEIMAPIEQVALSAHKVEPELGVEPISEIEAEETPKFPEQLPEAEVEAEPKRDFIDEPHRELEMPPKRRGFFARLFG